MCLKCVIVYLARDIPAFVMYCVNGESGLSLLIESTDSMIYRLYDSSSFFSGPSAIVSSSDAHLHVNPLHFLARNAVC